MYVEFLGPDAGTDQENISSEQMRTLLLERGREYWEAGSGDALLRVMGAHVPEIILVVREEYGVFVKFCDKMGHAGWVLCSDENDAEVDVVISGQTHSFERRYFVEIQLALPHILYFVETGRRSEDGPWRLYGT